LEAIVLTDPAVIPNEESVFARIGDKSLLWKEMHEYLYAHHLDISEEWKYYNDGKCWMLRYNKKKKTLCWIGVLETTFRVGFWFGNKATPFIEKSNLPEDIKVAYSVAKQYKIGRGLSVVVNQYSDVENVIRLIELKLKIK
jgi:hypothetical protein